MAAYGFAGRLKTLNELTPHEHVAKVRASKPDRLIVPTHQMLGLNT